MTGEQKQQIYILRRKRMCFADIAAEMGLPRNTIKTFCWRNGLTDADLAAGLPNRGFRGFCKTCGKELTQRTKSREAQSQTTYQERYIALVSKYEAAKSKLEELQTEKKSRLLRRQKIESFLDNMREQDGLLQDFDEAIFRTLVDRMTVYSKFIVSVRFRDGREIRVNPQK